MSETSQTPDGGPVVNPPGSIMEELPPGLLALLPPIVYVSTACQTASACEAAAVTHPDRAAELLERAEVLHKRCRLNQKFTGGLCRCGCPHPQAPGPGAAGAGAGVAG